MSNNRTVKKLSVPKLVLFMVYAQDIQNVFESSSVKFMLLVEKIIFLENSKLIFIYFSPVGQILSLDSLEYVFSSPILA